MKPQNISARGGSLPAVRRGAFGGKIIIANWKMNLSVKKGLEFVKNIKSSKNEIVIAAPYTFLCELSKIAKKKNIKLAAQDVAEFSKGAYTGEISAPMLKRIGCAYCLVGHSERRIYFNETDRAVNRKIKQLLAENIKAVLCIGETEKERDKKLTKKVLKKQLTLGLKNIKKASKILIAYEPVWAISTFQKGSAKHSAEIKDIIEAHLYIKKVLKDLYSKNAVKVKVLYGGTVNPKNSKEILNLKEVDGALVGGASLKVSSFNDIIKSV